MKIHQLSLFLENKPGQLSCPCQVLAKAGINILTLSLADTQQFGILRLIVREDEKATRRPWRQAGCVVNVTEVVAIEVADRPGRAGRGARGLRAGGLNIEYMYAFTFRHQPRRRCSSSASRTPTRPPASCGSAAQRLGSEEVFADAWASRRPASSAWRSSSTTGCGTRPRRCPGRSSRRLQLRAPAGLGGPRRAGPVLPGGPRPGRRRARTTSARAADLRRLPVHDQGGPAPALPARASGRAARRGRPGPRVLRHHRQAHLRRLHRAATCDRWSGLCARFLVAGGLRPEHLVHVAFGYGLFTGGFGLH